MWRRAAPAVALLGAMIAACAPLDALRLRRESVKTVLFVSLREAQEIRALDAASGREIWSLELPSVLIDGLIYPPDPRRLIGSRDGASLYVTCSNRGALAAIDVANEKLKGMLTVPGGAAAVAAASDGRVFVGSKDSIAVIDAGARRVLERIPLGATAASLALEADEKRLLAATDQDELVTIDLEKRESAGRLHLGTPLMEIVLRPHTGEAFIPLGRAPLGSLLVVDLAELRLVEKIAVGAAPTRVVFTPDGATAYVLNSESRTVSIVDAERRRVRGSFPLAGGVSDLAISATRGELYASHWQTDSIAVFTLEGVPSRTIELPYGAPKWPAGLLVAEEAIP